MPIEYIDTKDDPLLYERVEGLQGGMDAYTRASLLPPNVAQYLQNIIIDSNGLAKTRFGADGLGTPPASGRSQGVAYFDTPTYELLLLARGGAIRKWDGATWASVGSYTALNSTVDVTMKQGFDKVYISDGSGNWYSYDGATATDLGNTVGAAGSPPVGATLMEWHTERMFASGVASKPDTIWVSDPLDAIAGKWNHADFSFRVGRGEGENIVAIASMQDSFLIVFKQDSIWIVNAPPESANAAAYQIQTLTRGVGCVGKRAWCRNGNDILFMSRDGVRSLRRMEYVGNDYEVSLPISQPMQPYIDQINWSAANTICAIKYRHFVFFAIPTGSNTSPDTVLVWNARTETWMGVWTGWTPNQFVITRFLDLERLIISDSTGKCNQWKDYASEDLDSTYLDNAVDIATDIKLRSFMFGEPVNNKDGRYFEARFVESSGNANISVWYDDAVDATFPVVLDQGGTTLPVYLPFFLAVTKPATVRRALDAVGEFNEAYLEIAATSKKLALRNATMAAFIKTLQNQ